MFELPDFADMSPSNCLEYVILHGLDDVLAYLLREEARIMESVRAEDIEGPAVEALVRRLLDLRMVSWVIAQSPLGGRKSRRDKLGRYPYNEDEIEEMDTYRG